jgi:hypothetical protein
MSGCPFAGGLATRPERSARIVFVVSAVDATNAGKVPSFAIELDGAARDLLRRVANSTSRPNVPDEPAPRAPAIQSFHRRGRFGSQ